MKDELISFETAKLAKEKGFSWECVNVGTIVGHIYGSGLDNHNQYRGYVSIPTQSLLQRWLREGKDIDITVITNFKSSSTSIQKSYRVGIVYIENSLVETFFLRPKNNSILDKVFFDEFKIYEEALESGLKEALKLINQQ